MKKPNRVKLLISCGADIGVKNSEGLSALYFINKNVPECMKNFEQRLDTGVSLSQSRDERRIELSMNLRVTVPRQGILHEVIAPYTAIALQ